MLQRFIDGWEKVKYCLAMIRLCAESDSLCYNTSSGWVKKKYCLANIKANDWISAVGRYSRTRLTLVYFIPVGFELRLLGRKMTTLST